MERRTRKVLLVDGKEYAFSERNRRDTNASVLFAVATEEKVRHIERTVEDRETRESLLHYLYNSFRPMSEAELQAWGGYSLLLRIAYDSFKIANPDVTREEFERLAESVDAEDLVRIVNELEADRIKKKEAARPSPNQ